MTGASGAGKAKPSAGAPSVAVGTKLRGLAPIGVRWHGTMTISGPKPDKGCPPSEWSVTEAWRAGAWCEVEWRGGALCYKPQVAEPEGPSQAALSVVPAPPPDPVIQFVVSASSGVRIIPPKAPAAPAPEAPAAPSAGSVEGSNAPKAPSAERVECAACGGDATGSQYEIHRDGINEGPEVAICTDCGGHVVPTCEELWEAIAARLGKQAPPRRKRGWRTRKGE